MKFCKRCLYPENHALNIVIDKEGICSGCRVHEEKDILNWNEREKQLIKLLEQYRNKSQSNYDCIIPVTGGKDSYFIVDLIKNKYKMNPLLVAFNKTFNTKQGIINLQYLKTIFGCDLVQFTMNPNVAKNIVRKTFFDFGNINWLNQLGMTTFPVQVAQRFKIPLIIWGVHQGLDQVGMFSHTDEVEMTRKYRKEHDLCGYDTLDIVDEKNSVYERDLIKLDYPSDKQIHNIGIRGIYLGNYIRWDSKLQHEEMIKRFNYRTLSQNRTFIPYDNVDCFFYSDIHDYFKYLKFGYGKVNDHVSREIRLNHISKEEGVSLINKYKDKDIVFTELFLKYLTISKKEFENNIEKFRNKNIWEQIDGVWKLKHTLAKDFDEINLGVKYINNECDAKEEDILLFHKGVYL